MGTTTQEQGPERARPRRRSRAVTAQLVRAMGPIEYLLFAVIALGIAVVVLLVIVDPSA